MIKEYPEPLIQHDLISIAQLSSPFNKKHLQEGLKVLESWGFQTQYSSRIFQKQGYLSGSDSSRLQNFVHALNHKESKAILFARGGYGALRVLQAFKKIKQPKTPKIIVGYSDLTCVLLYILQEWNWPVIYGPVVAKGLNAQTPARTLKSLKTVLTDDQLLEPYTFKKAKAFKHGTVKAPLTGGCLSLICSTLGTPFEINTDNKILFIEDVNEKPHAIDRMLMQLKLAGKFKKCKGLVVGSMQGDFPASHYEAVIKSVLKDFSKPILFGIDAGHGKVQVSLPLGIQTELNTRQKSLTFLKKHNK